ncbi:hypothetical protein LX69_00255 [Breznakibacter xylanolyticus]|uniref:Uncharacterized protein n=1 Tax=Breznakibacter xylanolyticus TaxID=990 RepID=A0A2W7NJ31_9BACT|nr:hypothetical protein LX69_00255 [Breznakibacter xylanolyticus]
MPVFFNVSPALFALVLILVSCLEEIFVGENRLSDLSPMRLTFVSFVFF